MFHLFCFYRLRRYTACFIMLSLISATVLSACGTVQNSVPISAPTKPTPTPTVPSQSVSFADGDGMMLYGTLYGQGKRAIILSNEGDNDPTSWIPVALQLASRGYLVLGFAYRSEDNTDNALAAHTFADLRAAITFMHMRNIKGITLMGSSLGGLLVVKAATIEKFDAVVTISAPIEYQDVQLSDAELQRVSSPRLFVTSDQNDPYTGDTLHMYDTTPAPKEKQVYPGRHHGIALFQDHLNPGLLSVLLQFLQRYVPAN